MGAWRKWRVKLACKLMSLLERNFVRIKVVSGSCRHTISAENLHRSIDYINHFREWYRSVVIVSRVLSPRYNYLCEHSAVLSSRVVAFFCNRLYGCVCTAFFGVKRIAMLFWSFPIDDCAPRRGGGEAAASLRPAKKIPRQTPRSRDDLRANYRPCKLSGYSIVNRMS